jgi:hypothetical protein
MNLFEKLYNNEKKYGKKILKYRVIVENDIKINKNIFTKKINEIFNNPKGIKIKCIIDDLNWDFQIVLVQKNNIPNRCNFNTNKLSCVNDIGGDTIYLNEYRWKYGSKPSKLNLEQYRHYQIYHEFLHLCNQYHVLPIENKKCPIMVQQSISIGKAKPNFFPLPSEKKKVLNDYKDFVKKLEKKNT